MKGILLRDPSLWDSFDKDRGSAVQVVEANVRFVITNTFLKGAVLLGTGN